MDKEKIPVLTEIRGWSLKKKDIKNFVKRNTPDIGIVVNQYIPASEFTGFIKIPRTGHTDFGHPSGMAVS